MNDSSSRASESALFMEGCPKLTTYWKVHFDRILNSMEREDYIRQIRELVQLTTGLRNEIEEKKSAIKTTSMKLHSLNKSIAEQDKLIKKLTSRKKRLEKEIRACRERNSENTEKSK